MFSFLSWFQAAGAAGQLGSAFLHWSEPHQRWSQISCGREISGKSQKAHVRRLTSMIEKLFSFLHHLRCLLLLLLGHDEGEFWNLLGISLNAEIPWQIGDGKASGTAAAVNVNRATVQLCRCGNVSTTCSKRNQCERKPTFIQLKKSTLAAHTSNSRHSHSASSCTHT